MIYNTIESEKHTLNLQKRQATKVALVTGAARRIGAAIVRMLHEAGYSIALHYWQSEREARILAEELNSLRENSVSLFCYDLQQKKVEDLLLHDVVCHFARLDLLVNNASIFVKDDRCFNEQLWQKQVLINCEIPYRLSLKSQSLLQKTSGCIVNITDIHSQFPLKDYTIYCQTKAALQMQTKALAKEFAPFIRVNAVAPGAISWPEKSNALAAEIKEKIINETPLKQHGQPIFIAQAVLALVENPFITGQIVAVDGGRSIGR